MVSDVTRYLVLSTIFQKTGNLCQWASNQVLIFNIQS
jgi:hypothetical protein